LESTKHNESIIQVWGLTYAKQNGQKRKQPIIKLCTFIYNNVACAFRGES